MKKKFSSLLALGIFGAVLTAMPVDSNAATVVATSNSSSGIENANLTATLDDGTVLGFYRSGSSVWFCGAISQKTELSIPDSIMLSSTAYPVVRVGYSRCDFDNAQSVTSLILSATITSVNSLPSTIKVLHTNSYIGSVSSAQLSNLNKVLVPKETLDSYYGNEYWRSYVLINAEGTTPSKITINMTKPGEFAQILLEQTDNWYKVNELTVIGELNTDDLNVFKRMKQLTKLDLSKAVIEDIPSNFDGAGNTTSAYRDGFCILEEVILPEINNIGQYAFAQCYRLKKIAMPKVNAIGVGAFARCAISQITLPEGITSIANYAFYYSNLESITIPSSITAISNYCFSGCSGLRSISIPVSVTMIGTEAFDGTGLTSIDLPGIETIGYRAFSNCKQLAEVKFAEGLTLISTESFGNCTALTEIDLPATLQNVYYPFSGCTNIKKVISRAVVPPTHSNNYFILRGCDMTDVKLYVPAMSIDKYRAESGWKSFYTILPLEDKTSYAYIYDDATIDDANEFADALNLTLSWIYQNRNGSSQYYCGALDYNGTSTLSIHNYLQHQHLGTYSSYNQYAGGALFCSLIPNETMRADNVQTTLSTADATSIWYFISLPYDVKVSDITYTDDAQFAIRKYSGLNRAQQSGDTWLNLTVDSVMHAYEGYILKCNKRDAEFTFPAINNANKNKIFEKESVVMPLGEYLSEFDHNRSWNLIGNPYPCYYDTRRMDFTAPITVWNRYYNRYDAYSPIDDEYILHPAQSFFVQRPVGQASITFDKAGRQKDATVQALPAQARTLVAGNMDRKVYNVVISNGQAEDRTRFVINSEASCAYELDKDASKFIDDNNTSILVYTVENGVKYAINERPMENGIIGLGFYAPTDGDYTLSLNTLYGATITLIDHETNIETALADSYHFNAVAGFNDARFTLMFGEATGISTIGNQGSVFNIENGMVSGNVPYSVYTIDGQLVGNGDAGSRMKLTKGVYVINSKNVNRKVVVK